MRVPCCDPRGVLEQFTESAREVVVLAGDEARNSGQRNIGTEHLLLGLLDQDDGIAVQALGSLGVTADRVGDEIRVQLPWLTGERVEGEVPFTPRVARVLELARRESQRLSHPMIGPEHLLLGLIAANNGLAVSVLRTFGVEPAALIHAVDQVLPTAGGPVLAGRDRGYPETDGPIDDWLPMAPSQSLRRFMISAAGAADMAERSEIEVLDLLAAVTEFTNVALLSRLDVDDERLRRGVQRRWDEERKPRRLARRPLASHAASRRGDHGRRVACGQQARDLLRTASARAMERGGTTLEVSDVLLALTLDRETAVTLSDLGVDPTALRDALERCEKSD
jgi:ATP-dependent Clp protease ATP-binding subunit ClpA